VTVRHFTALGIAALMLHLNVVRADVACATHQAPAGQDAPMQHHMGAMGGSHAGDLSEGIADDADCETPAQKDCCQAVTSCSPALGFGVETQIAGWVPSHGAAGAFFSTRPLSRSTAPEPPPPRL
jgi:hypothetical protein